MEGLAGMNDFQLKRRKIQANDLLDLLNKEITRTNNRITILDDNMETNPGLPPLPYSGWTTGQLNDMKKALSKTLTRIGTIQMDFKEQFKGVDAELVARQ